MRRPGAGIPRNPGSGARSFRATARCGGSVRPYRRERVGSSPRIALRFRSPPSLLLPGVSRVANGLPRIGPCVDGAARGIGCPLPIFACLIFARPQLTGRNTPHGRFSGRVRAVGGRQGSRGIIPSRTSVFRKGAGTLTVNGAAGAVHRERCMEQHGYRAGIVAFA